jgi:hypothetical protein
VLDADDPLIQNTELTKLEDGGETIVRITSGFDGVGNEKEFQLCVGC